MEKSPQQSPKLMCLLCTKIVLIWNYQLVSAIYKPSIALKIPNFTLCFLNKWRFLYLYWITLSNPLLWYHAINDNTKTHSPWEALNPTCHFSQQCRWRARRVKNMSPFCSLTNAFNNFFLLTLGLSFKSPLLICLLTNVLSMVMEVWNRRKTYCRWWFYAAYPYPC